MLKSWGDYFLVLYSLKHRNTKSCELEKSNYCFAVLREGKRNIQGMYAEVFIMWIYNDLMLLNTFFYVGFKTFLSHHYYEGTISFQPAKHTLGSPRDKDSCRTG